MWKSCTYVFLFLTLICSPLARAQKEKITILAHKIPYFLETENSGAFVELSREIGKRLHVQLEFRFYPPARSQEEFRKKRGLILLPGSQPLLETYPHYASDPIFERKTFIFTQKGKVFSSLADLEGKRIGTILGYGYPLELPKVNGIEIQTVATEESNIRKLRAGRIDAFVCEETSALETALKLGVTNLKYDKDKPISVVPIFYAFQKTEEGLKWSKAFNDVLQNMKKSGELQKSFIAK